MWRCQSIFVAMTDKTKVEEVYIASLNYNENHILLLHFVHVGATSTVEKGEGAMGPHVIQNTSEKKCSHMRWDLLISGLR